MLLNVFHQVTFCKKKNGNFFFFFFIKIGILEPICKHLYGEREISSYSFFVFYLFFKFYNVILFIDNEMFLTTKCDYVVFVKNSSSFLNS